MSRHGACPLVCRHDGRQHETDSHQNLFRKNTVAYLDNTAHGFHRRTYFFLHNIGDADKVILFPDGKHTHNTGNHRAQHSCKGRSLDSQRRETEMPLNQQIVENNIHCIGYQICPHGNPGISGSPLSGIDTHLQNIENHSPHNNPEVPDCTVMSLFLRAAEPDNGVSRHNNYHTQNHGHDNQENQKSQKNSICFLLLLLSLPPCHQCRYRHICRDKQGQSQKFRLACQSHRRHRVRAKGTYHQRVHQPRKGSKKRLQHRRPCHV